jgi:glycosyltransferase involved in cell wall biosynthesis
MPARSETGTPLTITFLIVNVFGMGGTIRTVITLANHLARNGHRVEILSVFRRHNEPLFQIDDGVTVRALVDLRQRGGLRHRLLRFAIRSPSLLTNRHDNRYQQMSLWSDFMLLVAVRSLRSDVLVSTRPSLSLFVARFAPRGLATVAQEHTFVLSRPPAMQEAIKALYPRLDAVVTLTPAHHDDMERLLDGARTQLEVIPNSVDVVGAPQSAQENPWLVVAGRLVPGKQFNHLIRAFALVSRRHPDWKLRIFGSGVSAPRLQQLIRDLGLEDQVRLLGRSVTIEREFADAALTALTSRAEGLPMGLIEAMAAGVPPVSYDCPHGPRAIITNGHDGLLVPPDDIAALAQGIIRLIEDKPERTRMAAAARRTAMRFDSGVVAAEWVELFERLRARAPATTAR